MRTFSSDELASWLHDTQDYETSRDALDRIGGSVAGLNSALQALNTDTLFWTEPSNFESLLNQGSNVTGDSDE